MEERLTFNRSWSIARKHWRLFMLVGIAACVLSAVFSGPRFLKPRYNSQAVVYPVNLNSYSIESRADQLLQLLESNSTRDSIISRFRLVEQPDERAIRYPGCRCFIFLYGPHHPRLPALLRTLRAHR